VEPREHELASIRDDDFPILRPTDGPTVYRENSRVVQSPLLIEQLFLQPRIATDQFFHRTPECARSSV